MATSAHDKAMEFLKSQGYSDSQIANATAKIQQQQSSGQTTKQITNDVKQSTSSYLGTPTVTPTVTKTTTTPNTTNTTNTTKTTNTTNTSNNATGQTSANNAYGDVNGGATATSGMTFKNVGQQELGDLNQFGEAAKQMEANKSGSITNRNDIIASNLYNAGTTKKQDVIAFLNQQEGYRNASAEEKDNTINAIYKRLQEVQAQGGIKGVGNEDVNAAYESLFSDSNMEFLDKASKDSDGYDIQAGKYRDGNGNYVDILGYNALTDEQKQLVDSMDNAKKKELSNMDATYLQNYLKTYTAYDKQIKRGNEDKDTALNNAKEIKDQQDVIHDIQTQEIQLQNAQTLRKAEESINNMKQQWEYLGNMGMPGTSAVKLAAVSDAFKEAKTTFDELKKMQDLQAQERQAQWDLQGIQYKQNINDITTQYDRKIADLTEELTWKVPKTIQDAINKLSNADLMGQLDTIDGVTAFKKSLLQELDANLSGITEGSLAQMQEINRYYQDLADKAYEENQKYKQNSMTINSDMSYLKGFYVDGNGNPILDDKGNVMKTPPKEWMEPVFDKTTGKLITFTEDENGNRSANVQQLWQDDTPAKQAQIAQMLQNGSSLSEILTSVPGADLQTISQVASLMGVQYTNGKINTTGDGLATGTFQGYTNATSGGISYQATDAITLYGALQGMPKSGTFKNGWCAEYVNEYLKRAGVTNQNIFGQSLSQNMNAISLSKEDIVAGKGVPSVGSVAIFHDPNAKTEAARKYGHVAIITGYDPSTGMMSVVEQNGNVSKGIGERQISINSNSFKGVFDPTNGGAISNVKADSTTQTILDKLGTLFTKYPGRATLMNLDGKNGKLLQSGTSLINADAASYYDDMQYIISNLSMERLSQMKQAGASFGSLTEGEWERIDSAATALKTSNSEQAFMENLRTIYNIYAKKAYGKEFTLDEIRQMVGAQGGTGGQEQEAPTSNPINLTGGGRL